MGPGAKLHHRDVIGVALRRMYAELRSERATEVVEDIGRELSNGDSRERSIARREWTRGS